MPKLDRVRRSKLKARVVAACVECVAAGRIPSERWLRATFPWEGAAAMLTLRDEARREGLIPPWEEARPVEAGVRVGVKGVRGLNGDTPEERAEVAARTREIRAEKLARGEEPARRPLSLADRLHRLRMDPELLERGEP